METIPHGVLAWRPYHFAQAYDSMNSPSFNLIFIFELLLDRLSKANFLIFCQLLIVKLNGFYCALLFSNAFLLAMLLKEFRNYYHLRIDYRINLLEFLLQDHFQAYSQFIFTFFYLFYSFSTF